MDIPRDTVPSFWPGDQLVVRVHSDGTPIEPLRLAFAVVDEQNLTAQRLIHDAQRSASGRSGEIAGEFGKEAGCE